MSLAGVRALWTVSSQSVRLENTCLELDFSLMQFQLVCCEQTLIFFSFYQQRRVGRVVMYEQQMQWWALFAKSS